MSRFKFIVVEGMDGTGKSTVVHGLADRLGARAVASVPSGLAALRPAIDASASLETRYAFYRFAVNAMADQIAPWLRHQPVVCDRWIYSTLAYHASLGLAVDDDEVHGIAAMPDHAFLLTASCATRRSRMSARVGNTRADRLFLDTRLDADVARRLARQGLHCIDTDQLGIDGVVHAITAAVGNPRTDAPLLRRDRWDAVPPTARRFAPTIGEEARYLS